MSTPDDAPGGVSPDGGFGRPSADDPERFARPDGWSPLEPGEPTQQAATEASRSDEPGASAPEPAPAESGPRRGPRRATAGQHSDALTTRRQVRLGMGLLVGLAVLALLVAAVLARLVTRGPQFPDLPELPGGSARPYPPSPLPSSAMPPPVETHTLATAKARWSVPVATLRPEVDRAEVVNPANDPEYRTMAIDAGRHWVVMTGIGLNEKRDWSAPAPGIATVLHGIDPATGEQRWSRPLRAALCATELLDGRIVCLEAKKLHAATGMPNGWQAHLIDPGTGQSLTSRAVTGGIVRIGVEQGRIILVEERQPGPHLLVHALGPDLAPAWSLDLAKQNLHDDWFTENRMVIRRDFARPDGMTLSRVRLRLVGKQTLALWGPGPSAFIDLKSGRLLGMVQCSRLVDDGERLWCNDLRVARSYDYSLKPLAKTPPGVRLGHPERDPHFGDVTVPLFINEDGQAVTVDRRTGAVRGVLVDTSATSTWGGRLDPSIGQSGTVVIIDDADGIIALDPSGSKPLWATTNLRHLDNFWLWNGRLVVPDSIYLHLLDPATGRTIRAARVDGGFYAMPMGPREDGAVLYAGGSGDLVRVELDAI